MHLSKDKPHYAFARIYPEIEIVLLDLKFI